MTQNGRTVELTPREFTLLLVLVRARDRRSTVIFCMSGSGAPMRSRTRGRWTAYHRLRKKLDWADKIVTVPKVEGAAGRTVGAGHARPAGCKTADRGWVMAEAAGPDMSGPYMAVNQNESYNRETAGGDFMKRTSMYMGRSLHSRWQWRWRAAGWRAGHSGNGWTRWRNRRFCSTSAMSVGWRTPLPPSTIPGAARAI